MVTLAEWPSESSYSREDFGGGSVCSRFVNLGLRATVRPVIGVWARYPALPWPYFAVDYAGGWSARRSVRGLIRCGCPARRVFGSIVPTTMVPVSSCTCMAGGF